MFNKVLGYDLLIKPRVYYIYIVVLNIINGNFGLVKSWQIILKPIGVRVLFVPFIPIPSQKLKPN